MEISGRPVWHEGELIWQQRAGMAERMAEVGSRVIRDAMPDQHRSFFESLPFALAGYENDEGEVWASMLTGDPGFIASPDARHLQINMAPAADDPIASVLRPGHALGLLGIELPTRRRNRANGRIEAAGLGGFLLAVEQSFGNCPKYIEKRDYGAPRAPAPVVADTVSDVTAEAKALIGNAGTFFVASIAGPGALPDVSHRGGRHGFVAIAGDGTLIVPDYTGNFFFNTLGNFLLDPRAGLLFPDFVSGDLLQLTGHAASIDDAPEGYAMPGAERYWQFKIERGQWLRNALPLNFAAGEVSSFSP